MDQRLSGLVDAAGILELTWTTTADRQWSIQQVTVEMETAPAGCVCTLRKGGALVTPLVPNAGVASGLPFIVQQPGQVVAVRWAGATPGDTGSVFVVYEVLPWGEG